MLDFYRVVCHWPAQVSILHLQGLVQLIGYEAAVDMKLQLTIPYSRLKCHSISDLQVQLFVGSNNTCWFHHLLGLLLSRTEMLLVCSWWKQQWPLLSSSPVDSSNRFDISTIQSGACYNVSGALPSLYRRINDDQHSSAPNYTLCSCCCYWVTLDCWRSIRLLECILCLLFDW